MNPGYQAAGSAVYQKQRRRLFGVIALGLLSAVAVTLFLPAIGGEISIITALRTGPSAMESNADSLVYWGTRVPRVLLGLLVGSSLALAGLIFQAVLRNPLAEPYILGISGGAAFGKAVAAVFLGGYLAHQPAAAPIACFLGAIAPVLFLQLFAAKMERFSSVTILLAGVMLNVFFSALILLMQYFADMTQVRQMFIWMMGGLDVIGYREILIFLPILAVTAATALLHARAMNLISLGHETAGQLGLETPRTIAVLIWTASILTAASVAVSGPIGFVGLVVPHTVRLLVGSDNRILAPASLLFGGVFLVVCDFIGWRGMEGAAALGLIQENRIAEIPVGVITSFVGGPFFLFLLVRHRRSIF
jgi:iron complex transport system permease protein